MVLFCAGGGGFGESEAERGWSKWSKWSFGHLVKIDFGQTENATIIIKMYFYYYSEHKHTSKMKMTKMTMTTLTASKRCTSLEKVVFS